MSSTYRAICIAHTPALIPSDGHANAEAAMAHARAGDHLSCELLVGRWSGALVIGSSGGMDWITQLGIVTAAGQILNDGYEEAG